ncbi:MAG: tRNA 4-thiouridine(8) synthase ThiI, partial [Eubacterium sp.]|nr:tRNA 4-thiouridine(8) synthase ThiI [Eubacterium sp.]
MNEQYIFIVRTGEVALKGMNKPYFEKKLVSRIRTRLNDIEGGNAIEVKRHEGLIFVRAPKELDPDAIVKKVSQVFGVSSMSRAIECESDMDAIG